MVFPVVLLLNIVDAVVCVVVAVPVVVGAVIVVGCVVEAVLTRAIDRKATSVWFWRPKPVENCCCCCCCCG